MRQYYAWRREREQQAAERAALVAGCKERLAAIDSASINKLQAKAAAALNAYVAAMAAYNEQLNGLRDELHALGSQLPADVNLGSHENGHGLTIGDVDVRRQRLQQSVSRLAMDVLRSHIKQGSISLDRPWD